MDEDKENLGDPAEWEAKSRLASSAPRLHTASEKAFFANASFNFYVSAGWEHS